MYESEDDVKLRLLVFFHVWMVRKWNGFSGKVERSEEGVGKTRFKKKRVASQKSSSEEVFGA